MAWWHNEIKVPFKETIKLFWKLAEQSHRADPDNVRRYLSLQFYVQLIYVKAGSAIILCDNNGESLCEMNCDTERWLQFSSRGQHLPGQHLRPDWRGCLISSDDPPREVEAV